VARAAQLIYSSTQDSIGRASDLGEDQIREKLRALNLERAA